VVLFPYLSWYSESLKDGLLEHSDNHSRPTAVFKPTGSYQRQMLHTFHSRLHVRVASRPRRHGNVLAIVIMLQRAAKIFKSRHVNRDIYL